MNNLPKLGLVLAVLAIGFLAALPFRNRGGKTSATGTPRGDGLILRRHVSMKIESGGALSNTTPVQDQHAAGGQRSGTGPATLYAAAPGKGQQAQLEPGSVPQLEAKYRPFDGAPASSWAASPPISDRPGAPEGNATATALSPLTMNLSTSDHQRFIRHTIVDGDTLSGLAQRYLGDSRLELELYELNRHVLVRPDVLPIGRELRIPNTGRAGS